MTTTEPLTVQAPPQEVTSRKSSPRVVTIAIVGLIALLLGGLVGWVIRGEDSGDVPSIVVAGGEEPTSRQEQMVEFHRDYIEAWRRGDVEAIRALYVPEGTLTFNGVTYGVASEEFADFVGLGTVSELLEPHLAHGSTMFNFVEVVGTASENTLRFTPSGELLLIEHVILNSSVT